MTDFTQDADEGVNAQDPDEGIDAEVESVLRAHASEVEGTLAAIGFPSRVIGPAVNDAALALSQARKKGMHVARPVGFLVVAASNSAKNMLRPLREKNEIPGSDVIGDIPGQADDVSLRVMLQMDVRRGLMQLPLRQRQALTLCELCGLSHEEAAMEMGITVAGVQSNLRRGLQGLGPIMREMGYQPRKREQGEGDQPRKEATR